MKLEEAFARADIIKNGPSTPKWSHTYMGFWWKIRKRYTDLILQKLERLGYEEWNFSDLIWYQDFNIMNDSIMDISKRSMYIDDRERQIEPQQRQVVAPTHEVPIYSWLRDNIKYASDLPLKIVHTGSAYRRPKKYPFPFALWERRSFIEGHDICQSSEDAKEQIKTIRSIILEILSQDLNVPYVESQRPLSTNNPISKYTLCQDVILPDFGRTQIAWMIYFHDDIFADPFWVRFKKAEENYQVSHTPSGLHFWFSDNLLLWTIVNSYIQETKRFYLPEMLIPYHAMIIVESGTDMKSLESILSQLDEKRLRYKVIHVAWKSDKKNVFKKLFIQWTPIIIGVNHDGRISLNIWDIWKSHASINAWDISELSTEALSIRWEKRWKRTREIYENILVDGEKMNIWEINQLLSEGKIIQIYMKQDDDVVLEFEKKLQHWEVLWFNISDTLGICKHTWESVYSRASISKRF